LRCISISPIKSPKSFVISHSSGAQACFTAYLPLENDFTATPNVIAPAGWTSAPEPNLCRCYCIIDKLAFITSAVAFYRPQFEPVFAACSGRSELAVAGS
jgi:hypothetical protein